LVFVIVTIGILSAVVIPRMQNSRLREAADQIISHIRYAQHLAIMDDQFDPRDDNWYRKRWQIFFEQESDNWIYTIYSDGNTNGQADETEIAINPQDSSKRLTGKTEAYITSDMNLGRKYGITGANGIKFERCGLINRLAFDHLGRPMDGNLMDHIGSYGNTKLITTSCRITIKDSSGDSLRIIIQPETGFAQITSL
jgi:type II secretory pathway pseudopilin PulG